MSPEIEADLLRVFADGERRRAAQVERTLETLTPRERRLVREAAVMGYVEGAMDAAPTKRGNIPQDSAIVAQVVLACISASERFGMIAAASEGRRPRMVAR